MNQPNWVDIVIGIVSGLAFLLSVILAVVEFRRYWLHLELKISSYWVTYFSNNEAVVLLRLVFVNPASMGKTINELKHTNDIWFTDKKNKQLVISWKEPEYHYDINNKIVTFSLPNEKKVMPYGDMVQVPLDVPPHQSCYRWYYLVVDLGTIAHKHSPFKFKIEAYDIYNSKLAFDVRAITVEDLKKIGLHL